ncbi:hypothetical protein CDL15_Pgr015671 [Punica granatum]|uniref:BURP domain-containing protein n=1 Tax=Punica granatum TaxID=22663 RepID=A0A218XPS8_PUNGR|nr:hypothetical protein CDL15_Pgr015671 [Punica granatum]
MSTLVDVGKRGVDVDAEKGKPGGGTQVGKAGKRTDIRVQKGGVTATAGGRKDKPVYVGVRPTSSFFYQHAALETQVEANPIVAKFFLEKDLTKGNAVTLHFTKSTNLATFLPQQERNRPNTKNLPEALKRFSVKPGSVEAELMATTIKECKEPGNEGEEKYCATSLESMVDYAESKLGKNMRALSTEIKKKNRMQKYQIEEDVKKIMAEGSKYVVCHKQNYPYAVFYCHKTQNY